jgi:hypothetical protein
MITAPAKDAPPEIVGAPQLGKNKEDDHRPQSLRPVAPVSIDMGVGALPLTTSAYGRQMPPRNQFKSYPGLGQDRKNVAPGSQTDVAVEVARIALYTTLHLNIARRRATDVHHAEFGLA